MSSTLRSMTCMVCMEEYLKTRNCERADNEAWAEGVWHAVMHRILWTRAEWHRRWLQALEIPIICTSFCHLSLSYKTVKICGPFLLHTTNQTDIDDVKICLNYRFVKISMLKHSQCKTCFSISINKVKRKIRTPGIPLEHWRIVVCNHWRRLN